MRTAVILLAHGTREPDASGPVYRYAEALAHESGMRVEPCMREFIEPSVPTVVGKLAGEGYDRILVVPFFLFKSGHVTRDIEEDIGAEQKKHPGVSFAIGEPVGFDPAMVGILHERLREVLSR
jgi:sirohydrochlorin cobaltochelatase